MEFRFSPEEEAFRQEVREFLRREWSEDAAGGGAESPLGYGGGRGLDEIRRFQKKLAQKGWLTLAWPKEYGGMGASVMKQVIFNEEMAYHRAPQQLGVGPDRVGPTIILYGTEEQKREHLPPIANAEVIWCQGFSEPGAGSDLASLQTTAVEDGDYFVVNGQKIWTSLAHVADWMILLARTDPDAPKHRGISYFLVDMRTPGITVRPLIDMTGRHAFNQVFFDNVRVPRKNLVGELNRGWYVAAATLDFERSGINRVMAGVRLYEELVEYARETVRDGRPLMALPTVRHKLAELRIEFEVGRLLAYRVAWVQAQGRIPNQEASMSKLFGSELQQRLARAGMEIMGLGGQLRPGSRWAPMAGRIADYYLGAVATTIAAGTSEVMRNIIAIRGLGLPRG
ncbi:MAG: acyl-CoA dehydrogenase family protein [Dehalococcoidia bacterium]|jgi:alkylation response protein AidB-like acyl-CoA dehydrogenase|nr:acyl-CoA dehydrogenase family protein [Dehalococcoidia bacterium]MDW8009692.1 acyl-CoA dehydrogenase family protein [Chloroflexota bacterium]